MPETVAQWWDGAELWITQLWYPLQVALLMAVLLPVCWAVAKGIDRGVDRVASLASRGERADPDETGRS